MFYFILTVILIVLIILFFVKKNYLIKSNPKKENKNEICPLNELIILNIAIRKNMNNEQLINSIEIIIDKLRDILPILNTSYKTSELTWVANKMATDYLQKVILPYLSLHKKEQNNKKSSLMSSLEQIEKELNEIIDLVNEKKISSFDIKAKFIKNRFK